MKLLRDQEIFLNWETEKVKDIDGKLVGRVPTNLLGKIFSNIGRAFH